MGCKVSKNAANKHVFAATSSATLQRDNANSKNDYAFDQNSLKFMAIRKDSSEPFSNDTAAARSAGEHFANGAQQRPHRVPKLIRDHKSRAAEGPDDDSQKRRTSAQSNFSNISAGKKGIAYEIRVFGDDGHTESIVKSHPPKALQRLLAPPDIKSNISKLMTDLKLADERKAKLMEERRMLCQSRREGRPKTSAGNRGETLEANPIKTEHSHEETFEDMMQSAEKRRQNFPIAT